MKWNFILWLATSRQGGTILSTCSLRVGYKLASLLGTTCHTVYFSRTWCPICHVINLPYYLIMMHGCIHVQVLCINGPCCILPKKDMQKKDLGPYMYTAISILHLINNPRTCYNSTSPILLLNTNGLEHVAAEWLLLPGLPFKGCNILFLGKTAFHFLLDLTKSETGFSWL